MRIFIDITSDQSGGNFVPAAVQNVQAQDMGSTIQVSWDEFEVVNEERDGVVYKYVVEKKVNDGNWSHMFDFTEEDWATGFFFYDTEITEGNTYNYRIKAVTTLSKETDWSKVATIEIEEETPATVPGIVSHPANPETSFNYIKLNWSVPDDGGSAITGYAIRRDGVIIENNWPTNEYIDLDAPSGNLIYNFAAINSVGQGGWSADKATQLRGWTQNTLVISSTRIDITINGPWQSMSTPHFWDIQRSIDNSNWVTIAIDQTGTYEDKGLTPDTLYFYRAVMKNEYGISSPSISSSVRTLESVRGTVTNITYASTYGSGQNFGYKQYVPADYDGNTATPLVIWLHGLGERSQSNGNPQFARLELYGPFKEYKDFEADYPFLMIAPQQPTDVDGKYTGRGSWDVEVIEESLNHFKAQGYNIDLDRVYITGQSMGGGGVLSYINSAYGNETIAAALPIASTLPQGTGIACNIKHIPIWLFHAENDPTVPSSNSKNLYTAIKACTPAPDVEPKITIFNLSSHTGWNQVYKNTGATLTDYADNSPFPDGTTWEDWLLQYSLQ